MTDETGVDEDEIDRLATFLVAIRVAAATMRGLNEATLVT